MIYLFEFLGLLAVAIALAASPVLINVLERFFPPLDEDRGAAGYRLSSASGSDRTEVRDEIRRVTSILEGTRLDTRRP